MTTTISFSALTFLSDKYLFEQAGKNYEKVSHDSLPNQSGPPNVKTYNFFFSPMTSSISGSFAKIIESEFQFAKPFSLHSQPT